MSNITLEKAGARLYVVGNSYPIKDTIKAAGGHWDGDRKQWWIGATKREEIEKAIAKAAGGSADDGGENTRVIGKAKYKGRTYFVAWAGTTKAGKYAMKLVFRDGSKSFWADASEYGAGSGELATWEKRYQEPKTIRDILAYAEKMKANPRANRFERDDKAPGGREYDGGPRGNGPCYMCGSQWCEGARGGLCDDD